MERATHFWSGASLELGFYDPGEVWLAVFAEDDVVAGGVDVFGVEDEAVHVKETCAHAREPGGLDIIRLEGLWMGW